MARIEGVDLPRNKPIWVALTSIYGIGQTTAKKIVAEAEVDPMTRVFQLSDHEVARLREIIQASYRVEGELRKEVATLKERIQHNVGGDTLKLEEEIAGLKKSVADGGKKEQRLKEMFNLKIQQFRAAVLQLFGFEINWKDKTFRLRPVYAESEEDVFIFQEAKKGLQMLDAPYCAQWQAEIQTYVLQAGSIPGFLSCVCQDLFNRQTVTMGIPNLSHLSAP